MMPYCSSYQDLKSINPTYLPISWLTMTTVLLCLPGSAIPQHRWFDFLMVDKWVHIFLFSVMTFLFARCNRSSRFWIPASAVLVYGIAMEFVQKSFVANRSFDIGDITADAVGVLLGLVIAQKMLSDK
jgi:VanZ family protein